MDVPSANTNIPDPQTTAQLEKLRLEIADLKWKVKWVYRVAQFVSVITAFVAVAAFVVSLRQFNSQQEQEFKKPMWDKQLGLVFEVSDVAATIATLPPDSEERKKAEARFWQIYYGPIVLGENQELFQGMIDFGNCLKSGPDCESEAQRSSRLPILSLNLTNKGRATLGLTWKINFDDLYKGKLGGTPSPLP